MSFCKVKIIRIWTETNTNVLAVNDYTIPNGISGSLVHIHFKAV